MNEFMKLAIEQAIAGRNDKNGIPIGSVLVHKGIVVGKGYNRRIQKGSAILHAEMDALESAGRRPATFYKECDLYTTLSPCAMCSGAILLYKIPNVIIGENRSFMGEEALLRDRGVNVEVLDDQTCYSLMQEYIRNNREDWGEDIGE